MTLVVDRRLVERLEAAEAEVVWRVAHTGGAAIVERWRGGVLVASPVAHRCRAYGCTMTALDRGDVDELSGWFEDRDAVPQVQLSSWAPERTVAALADAGFVPAWPRSLHARSLTAWDGGGVGVADDVTTELVDRRDLDAATTILLGALRGQDLPLDDVDSRRAAAEHDATDVVQLLARRGGEPAGAALMTVVGDAAFLGPAGTSVAHRRRGVQTALLARRLEIARAAGVEIAFVTADVDSGTARNVERLGFTLVQQQWVLRPG